MTPPPLPQGARTLRWTAVPATSIRIFGPATIRSPSEGSNYLYDVGFFADSKHLRGRSEIAWSTGADCENLATLSAYNGAVFVLPQKPGTCTLHARVDERMQAELAVAIE